MPTFWQTGIRHHNSEAASIIAKLSVRIAIISDIHSNLEALTSAFAAIDAEHVDTIVCLGDIVGYGANPNECLSLVRSRCSTILLGNHDAAALDLSFANQFTLNAQLSAIWTFGILLDENKAFLKDLPQDKTLGDVLLSHASPFEPKEWHYVISEYDTREAFRAFTERICFIGHSHIPVIFSERGKAATVSETGRFIVNVGSIGQPRDGNPNLSFGIFDTELWSYQNVRIGYDIDTAAEKIRKAGLPRTLAERLYHGM
ncbi:MAG: metallophosphoesterase family protein [Ignavibacteria bacterium]|nr:metallophosphoesterase family protein [Ignavibacteria bacterium]